MGSGAAHPCAVEDELLEERLLVSLLLLPGHDVFGALVDPRQLTLVALADELVELWQRLGRCNGRRGGLGSRTQQRRTRGRAEHGQARVEEQTSSGVALKGR